jgi:hypothetical protein
MQKLDDATDYPFCASLTKVARCGLCKHSNRREIRCAKGLAILYPTIAREHDCPHYEFHKGELRPNPFQHCGLLECKTCAFELDNFCSGKRWIPFKTEPHCEFYRPKGKTCQHAIPFHQEGSEPEIYRNNYCSLPPEQRDGDQSSSWKCCCYKAHTPGAENMKCYQPIEGERQ